jgi:hypothetical protein
MRGSSGRITQTGLLELRRAEILKKLRVLLPVKGQLYGGAQGVLPDIEAQVAEDASKRVGGEEGRRTTGSLV